MFNRAAYLERIGYRGSTAPSARTLAGLTLAHLRAVPFENLDIMPLGRQLRLDPAALFGKIVGERRGGFCFELNGLFAVLLEDIGFGVTRIACQFAQEDGGYGPAIDHLSLVVWTPEDGSWFVDVGGGRHSTATPLAMPEFQGTGPPGPPDPGDGSITRIERRGEFDHVWRKEPDGEWTEHMRCDVTARALSEFADRCRFYETSPDSNFRRGSVCTHLTPDGRISIRPGTLTVTASGVRTETPLTDERSLREALQTHFAIDLDRFRSGESRGDTES